MLSEKQLLFGNGSDDNILIVSRAILSWFKYSYGSRLLLVNTSIMQIVEGAEVREVPFKMEQHDLDEMVEAIDENTSIVWVCNPNNPTGTLIPMMN